MNLEDKSSFWSEQFKDLDMAGQTFSSKEFDGCTFTGCNFSEAVFKHCNFVDCEFIACNLSLVSIEYSKFADVSFVESKLVGINWTRVSLPSLVFCAPFRFYKSILNDSSFYGMSLQELVLDECKVHSVDFREGNFSNANFTYSDFSGSYFSRTNLTGADFSEATDYDIDIYDNTIKSAKFSRFEAVRLLDSLEIELVD